MVYDGCGFALRAGSIGGETGRWTEIVDEIGTRTPCHMCISGKILGSEVVHGNALDCLYKPFVLP